MTDEQRANIKRHVLTLEPTASENDATLEFVISETVDRVLLHLRASTLNDRLDRIIARIVAKIYRKTAEEINQGGKTKRDVQSLSDNGQSITYASAPIRHLESTTDSELFEGYAELLAPYRRVNVVRK